MMNLNGTALVGLIPAAALLYGLYIPVDYYADDFGFVFENRAAVPWYYQTSSAYAFYRPIEAALLALIQENYGLNTLPLNLLHLTLHLSLCVLIYFAMVGLGYPALYATLGSYFMMISQANVHAVLSNDTFSQISSTLFGCMSLWLSYRSYEMSRESSAKQTVNKCIAYHYLSVMLSGLAMFCKESGIIFVAILAVFHVWAGWDGGFRVSHLNRLPMRLLAYGLPVAVYLFLRWNAHPYELAIGTGRYDFKMGTNILVNVGSLISACSLPVSSVAVFGFVKTGQTVELLVVTLFSSALLLAVMYGLCRSRNWSLPIIMASLAVITCFPVALLNHVSELHAYNSMPFVSIVVAAGIGKLVEERWARSWAKLSVSAIVVGLVVGQVTAVHSKAAMMKNNGVTATHLMQELRPCVTSMPRNGRLVLVNPKASKPSYSIFVMNGFDVLDEAGIHRLKQLSMRTDLHIRITDGAVTGNNEKDPRDGVAVISHDGVSGSRMVTCHVPIANKASQTTKNAGSLLRHVRADTQRIYRTPSE